MSRKFVILIFFHSSYTSLIIEKFDADSKFVTRLDRRWPAADEDAPRREVADHTKLRYGCGVCVQRLRLFGGEKYEGSENRCL